MIDVPAKRVPWYKMWVGGTRHPKVSTLDHLTFRVWVELLDAAAEQPVRGKFANATVAASVIRRPVAAVKKLLVAGLVDQREDGIWMHDWQDWQRWRSDDDMNGSEPPPESPTEQHANNTRTTTDERRNGSGSTHEEHTNVNPKKEEIRDKSITPTGSAPKLRVVGEPAPKPQPKQTPVGDLLDKIKALDPDCVPFGDMGFTGSRLKANPGADLGLIAEAYVSFRHGRWPGTKMLRESGSLAWVIGDVGGYVEWRKATKTVTSRVIDRTGTEN